MLKLYRVGWLGLLALVFWQAVSPAPMEATLLINDKLGHLLVFFILGMSGWLVWTRYSGGLHVFSFLAVYGLAIEVAQFFVPGRTFSLLDWAADLAGLIMVLLVIKLAGLYQSRPAL